MAEESGIGARCEFLVVCSDVPITGPLEEAIMIRFPAMTCSFRPDYSCDALVASSCIAYVGTLGAEQHASGCELSLKDRCDQHRLRGRPVAREVRTGSV